MKVKIIQKLFARNKRFCNSISILIINQRNIISTSNKLTIKIFHSSNEIINIMYRSEKFNDLTITSIKLIIYYIDLINRYIITKD